jgi:penicillin-binding protein 2
VFAGAGYLSGGKTGTAQAVTIGQKDKYDARKLEEHQLDHALYVAFAPAQDPKIAIAVVVENSGFGAEHAAPIVRRIFDYWLLQQYPNETDMAAVQEGKAAAPIGKPRAAADVPWPLSGAALAVVNDAVGAPPSAPVQAASSPATKPVTSTSGLRLTLASTVKR